MGEEISDLLFKKNKQIKNVPTKNCAKKKNCKKHYQKKDLSNRRRNFRLALQLLIHFSLAYMQSTMMHLCVYINTCIYIRK